MKNITVSIDDETYRQARITAAEREQSVSAMVRDLLQTLATLPPDDHAAQMTRLFEIFDQAKPFAASERLTREEMYVRGQRP